jgi:dTDP-4-dehydrorhamnose reductase
MNSMRIVITGHKGQLGQALEEQLQQHDLLGVDLPEHDIAEADEISQTICRFGPEVVIHTAAWTDVEGCADRPQVALQINGLGTHNVALACLRCDATLLTVSTNEVFDGHKGAPYYEHERCNPSNPYARSKWAAEVYTRMHLSRFYIVRTAWLFGRGGNNFPAKIISAAKTHNHLRVVCDEISSPTYAPDLAHGIAQLVQTEHFGIYHLTNEGVCSRYEFARRILELAGMADVPVEPITSDQWPRASTPPLHCAIRNLAGAALGIQLRYWDLALREYFGTT